MIDHVELAQFVFYRGAKIYKTLFNAIIDFWSGRGDFEVAANFFSSSRYIASEIFQGRYGPRDQVGSKKVIMYSKAPPPSLERNLNALADRFDDLLLIIKKNQSQDGVISSRHTHDRFCSFCKPPVMGQKIPLKSGQG